MGSNKKKAAAAPVQSEDAALFAKNAALLRSSGDTLFAQAK